VLFSVCWWCVFAVAVPVPRCLVTLRRKILRRNLGRNRYNFLTPEKKRKEDHRYLSYVTFFDDN